MDRPASLAQQQLLEAYDLYADAIFRHCALRVSDRELGKDLMQDAFMRTWESIASGTRIENMRAFLYRIANNLIIDHYRRMKLRRTESLEDLSEQGVDIADEAPDPSHLAHGHMVMQTLEKLPEQHRAVLVMRYVDGLPPRDIGQLLNVSANVVSVRLHRALAELETLLKTQHA